MIACQLLDFIVCLYMENVFLPGVTSSVKTKVIIFSGVLFNGQIKKIEVNFPVEFLFKYSDSLGTLRILIDGVDTY